MAKSKNHTANNQSKKAHRNGIKKTRRPRKGAISMMGVNQKFVRNQKYARNGMKGKGADKDERQAAQKDAQKKLEEKKAQNAAKQKKEHEDAKQAAVLAAATKKR